MALLGGRDALNGLLAKPDTWSFTTGGRIWINQGWLSGVLFYLSYKHLQELGPVLIKGSLLAACLGVTYWRCRRLKVSTEVSLAALIVGTLAVANLLSIRAENFAILYFVLLCALLTLPVSRGYSRQMGVLLIMLIWSNSHGSFLIGFMLIGAKALVRMAVLLFGDRIPALWGTDPAATTRNSGSSAGLDESAEARAESARRKQRQLRDIEAWLVTLGLCLPVMAFANPYGPGNLFMPFRQTGAVMWTASVGLWQPLVKIGSHYQPVLYMGYLSVFFLAALFFMVLVAFSTAAMVGFRRFIPFLAGGQGRDIQYDLIADVLIFLIITGMAFRFGRTIVFAGLGMVPILAFLMQSWIEALSGTVRERAGSSISVVHRYAASVISCMAFASVLWFFLVQTLPPFLPNNPLFAAASPIKRIFGTPKDLLSLADFVKENRVGDRIFADLLMSDLLLLRAQGVKVFMDLRAQSMYSDKVCEDYLSVALVKSSDGPSVNRALEVLDRYAVSAVVLPTDDEYWYPAIETLSESKKWSVVFADTSGFVFVPSQSGILKSYGESGRMNGLRYHDRQSQVLSLAFSQLMKRGLISPEVANQMKNLAAVKPVNLVYRWLAFSGRSPEGCLDEAVRSYLIKENERLGRTNLAHSGSYQSVLGSMLEIITALESDARSCRTALAVIEYSRKRSRLLSLMESMRDQFSPWL